MTCCAVRELADDQASRLGGALQPRCGVDDVARHHRLTELGTGSERDERFARVDRGPGLEPEHLRGCEHPQACAHCPLGIVLARDRGAEDGHDRVADVLFDHPAVPLDLLANAGMVGL